MNTDRNNPLVYSTEKGSVCPVCGFAKSACRCPAHARQIPDGRRIRVHRETSGRRGKVVTVISGLPLDDDELKEIAKALKTALATGGSVKEGNLIIQGDHVARSISWLQERGHHARKG